VLVSPEESMTRDWQETAQVNAVAPPLQPAEPGGAFRIYDGELAGKIFLLDRPVITVGRGTECEVVLNDISVSRRHSQFLRQASGNYAQDLSSRNGTMVNNEPLTLPRLLVPGDIVCVGNISLEYISLETARTAPISLIIPTRSASRSVSSPMPLKLPSKPKDNEKP
jgi:pSer/pThr/pTyr-binding forkhead associated (FHA) protein